MKNSIKFERSMILKLDWRCSQCGKSNWESNITCEWCGGV